MTGDRVRIEMSNCDGEDYVCCLWTLTASLGEHRVAWKLPDRLISRPEVAAAAFEEIVNELRFYIDRIVPIKNRFRSAS